MNFRRFNGFWHMQTIWISAFNFHFHPICMSSLSFASFFHAISTLHKRIVVSIVKFPRTHFNVIQTPFANDWRMERHVDIIKHRFWCSDFFKVHSIAFHLILFYLNLIVNFCDTTNKFGLWCQAKKSLSILRVRYTHLSEELVTAQCLIW